LLVGPNKHAASVNPVLGLVIAVAPTAQQRVKYDSVIVKEESVVLLVVDVGNDIGIENFAYTLLRTRTPSSKL